MAEEKESEVTEEGKGGSKKLMIIIIAVLVLALIGVGVMMFLGGGDENSEETTTEEAAPEVKAAPVYYTFADAFITNFTEQSAGEVKYMQIKMKVMARSQPVIDAMDIHLPAIQHQLNLLFLSQKYDELQTIEGNQALKQACTDTINQVLADNDVEGELEAVYFTSFIMQ